MNEETMLIGDSLAMQSLYETAKKAANSHCTIILTGESGTGKELLARDIHAKSPRLSGPFIAINCGAMAETLLESELFGHERGSFTGATSKHLGIFEQAEGGTIFLDEIGEMTPALQAKILRVLEKGEIRRVGGTKTIKVNARTLSATNAKIENLVTKQKFREDLYFRINTIDLHLPPLRERPEDISPFSHYFRELANKKHGRDVKSISPGALSIFHSYSWPGNIRQLRNSVEALVVLNETEEISEQDTLSHFSGPIIRIPANIDGNMPPLRITESGIDLRTAVDQYRAYMVGQALKITNGNKYHAARLLNYDRRSLYRLIDKK
jgi:transcriptional regulator with PAS, ATPase and Fis domain